MREYLRTLRCLLWGGSLLAALMSLVLGVAGVCDPRVRADLADMGVSALERSRFALALVAVVSLAWMPFAMNRLISVLFESWPGVEPRRPSNGVMMKWLRERHVKRAGKDV